MKRISALFAGLLLASTLAITATTQSAAAANDGYNFGECVKNGVVQPGRNGTGITGDGFYGPFDAKPFLDGRTPFDVIIGCSPP